MNNEYNLIRVYNQKQLVLDRDNANMFFNNISFTYGYNEDINIITAIKVSGRIMDFVSISDLSVVDYPGEPRHRENLNIVWSRLADNYRMMVAIVITSQELDQGIELDLALTMSISALHNDIPYEINEQNATTILELIGMGDDARALFGEIVIDIIAGVIKVKTLVKISNVVDVNRFDNCVALLGRIYSNQIIVGNKHFSGNKCTAESISDAWMSVDDNVRDQAITDLLAPESESGILIRALLPRMVDQQDVQME